MDGQKDLFALRYLERCYKTYQHLSKGVCGLQCHCALEFIWWHIQLKLWKGFWIIYAPYISPFWQAAIELFFCWHQMWNVNNCLNLFKYLKAWEWQTLTVITCQFPQQNHSLNTIWVWKTLACNPQQWYWNNRACYTWIEESGIYD